MLERSSILLPMNTLTLARKAAVVRCLIDGASLRATSRMTKTDKDTCAKILVEVGEFCAFYQRRMFQNLPTVRVEADEIWSFVGAKEANKTNAAQGDLWTYSAIDADNKLIFSWLVGKRTSVNTHAFMRDVASRLANRVQISTDGHGPYKPAVEKAFGWNGCDFATIEKEFGSIGSVNHGRYSPSTVVTRVEVTEVMGKPKRSKISTSYMECANLSIRMNNRRFTRLTNAYSKKAENHAHSIALHFFAHNFLKAHGTLTTAAKGIKTTPAMAAGVSDHQWTVEEMMAKIMGTFILYANAA
jgi:IS1 family transposase